MNGIIGATAFERIIYYIEKAKSSPEVEILTGGRGDKSTGYFIETTIFVTQDPHFITMEEEIFGAVMTIYTYDDKKYEETLKLCDGTSPYG